MATISGEEMAYQRVQALFEAGQREFISKVSGARVLVRKLQYNTKPARPEDYSITVTHGSSTYFFSASQFLDRFEPASAQPKETPGIAIEPTLAPFVIGQGVQTISNLQDCFKGRIPDALGTIADIHDYGNGLVYKVVHLDNSIAWYEHSELVGRRNTCADQPSWFARTRVTSDELDRIAAIFGVTRREGQKAEGTYQTPTCNAKFLNSALCCCDSPLDHSGDHKQTFSDGSYIGWANPHEAPVAAVLLRRSDSRLPVALQHAIERLDADCGALSLGAAKQLQKHLARLRDTLRAAIDLVRQRRVTARGYGRIKDCCLTVLGSCCAAYTGGRYSEVEELAIVNAIAVRVDQAAATLKNSLFKLPEDDSLERRLEATPFDKPEIQLTVDREQDPDEPLLRYQTCPTCDYRWTERPSTRVSSCSKCGWDSSPGWNA
jgi:hypothetical protein